MQIRKISLVFTLLFSIVAVYSQCEIYLNKADAFFSQSNYEDAKKQYLNYKECKPNASGIDAKIADCDRLLKNVTITNDNNTSTTQIKEEKIYYNENWQGCSQYQAQFYRIAKYDKDGKPVGKIFDYYITGELKNEIDGAIYIDKNNDKNSIFGGYAFTYYKNGVKQYETQFDKDGKILSQKNWDEKGNLKVPRTKTTIGIGSFTGYKSDQAETAATNAFKEDGRFIVSKMQNYRYGNNQQTSDDIDYILSGNATLTQRAQTTYVNGGKYLGNVPIVSQEVVSVVLTLTNAKTGQVVLNSTYNLNKVYRVSSDYFPVKFNLRKINGKNADITLNGDGTAFTGDKYNVYEMSSNGTKRKIGALKIGKTYDKCPITDGAREIKKRFEAGAKMIVER